VDCERFVPIDRQSEIVNHRSMGLAPNSSLPEVQRYLPGCRAGFGRQ